MTPHSWKTILFHAQEELEALKMRKKMDPLSRNIDRMLKAVELRIKEAKSHLL